MAHVNTLGFQQITLVFKQFVILMISSQMDSLDGDVRLQIFSSSRRFISVDICSEGHNCLSNSDLVSDLVVEKLYSFLQQIISSKFCNTGKLIPFIFEGKYMYVVNNEKKGQLAFS